MVNTTLLLLVQDNLQGLAAVLLGADALADDLDGVDQVGQDGVVDGGQSAGTGALLGLGGARVDGALGAGQNAALSNEENVAVRELLLQLAGQTVACNISLDVLLLCWVSRLCGAEIFLWVCGMDIGERISYRCWILWKPWRRGTGTKMTMAFLPWPTST